MGSPVASGKAEYYDVLVLRIQSTTPGWHYSNILQKRKYVRSISIHIISSINTKFDSHPVGGWMEERMNGGG